MGSPTDAHIIYGAPQYELFGPFSLDEATEILEKEGYVADDRFLDKKKWIRRVEGVVENIAFIVEVRGILNDCYARLEE